MRTAFIQELGKLALDDPSIFLMVADLGFDVVEPFAKNFPQRFLNAGIAEQNMTGMAAGMGRCGYNVFTYSIANFPTLRCLEQIRNDVCYHRSNVKVVSVGAGLAYGSLGYSHHAVQDLACLRSLPGMLMATPCDPIETRAATRYLRAHAGPAYLRLNKAKDAVVHEREFDLVYPAFNRVTPATTAVADVAILACGSVAKLAKDVAAASGAAVYSAALWSCDEASARAVAELVDRHRRLVVFEEHLAAGGFGSFVRECLEPWPQLQARVRCLSLDSRVCGEVGSQAFLRQRGGLCPTTLGRALAA